MKLTCLKLHQIRGFGPQATLRLGPQLNVYLEKDVMRRRSLISMIFYSLFPATDDAGRLSALALADDAAAELTFSGHGGQLHRLVRSAASRKVQLFDLTAEGKGSLVSENPQEIGAHLRARASMPEEAHFRRLFTFIAKSDRGAGQGASVGQPVAPGLPKTGQYDFGALQRRQVGSPAIPELSTGDRGPAAGESDAALQGSVEAEARILRLTEELGRWEALEEDQASIDALVERRGVVPEAMAETQTIEEELATLDRELGDLAPLVGLSKEILKKLEHLDERKGWYERERARLHSESEENSLQAAENDRILLNPGFLAGAGGGLLLLGVAVVIHSRWLALLNLPFVGWAAKCAFDVIGVQDNKRRASRRNSTVKDRLVELTTKEDEEMARLNAIAEALGATSGDEISRKVEAFRDLQERRDELEEKFNACKAGEGYRQAAAMLQAMDEEIRSRQANFDQKKASLRPRAEIRLEIESIRKQFPELFSDSAKDAEVSLEVSQDLVFEDDEEDGYGSGYGGSSGGREEGELKATAQGGYWAASGQEGSRAASGRFASVAGGNLDRSSVLMHSAESILGEQRTAVGQQIAGAISPIR